MSGAQLMQTVVNAIGFISGLMSIDNWLKERYSKKITQATTIQNFYIFGDVIIDKKSSSKVKELDN